MAVPKITSVSLSDALGNSKFGRASETFSMVVNFDQALSLAGAALSPSSVMPSLFATLSGGVATGTITPLWSSAQLSSNKKSITYTGAWGTAVPNGDSSNIIFSGLSLTGITINGTTTPPSLRAPFKTGYGLDNTLPVLSVTPTSASVTENASVKNTVFFTASTTESNRFSYSLQGSDASLFSLDSAGRIKLKASADYETKSIYRLTLRATDSAGNSADKALVLNVVDANEPVTLKKGVSGTGFITVVKGASVSQVVANDAISKDFVNPEGAGLVTYNTTNTLSAGLTLSAAGVLSGTPTTSATAYNVTVTSSDNNDNGNARIQDAKRVYRMSVIDKPMVYAVNLSDAQDLASSGKAGQAVSVKVTLTEVVTASSMLANSNVSISLYAGKRALTGVSYQSIASESGKSVLTFTGTLPAGDSSSIVMTGLSLNNITLTGNNSQGTLSGRINNPVFNGVKVSSSYVLDNSAPKFSSSSKIISVTVAENIATTTSIYTAVAKDANAVTYSLAGADNNQFNINPSTGVITLANSPNYEDPNNRDHRYSVTLIATDSNGNSSSKPITVNISDLNEAVALRAGVSATGTQFFATNAVNSLVLSKDFIDPEGRAITYTLIGTLPEGLSLSNGTITGRATGATSSTITIQSSDNANNGNDASRVYILTTGLDSASPSIASVSLTSATGALNQWLNTGDVVTASVRFNEDIALANGSPTLSLNVGGTIRTASLQSKTNDSLLFSYTIQATDNDSDGISIDANALTLSGASIVDAAGNSANITHAAVSANTSYRVDSVAPTATVTLSNSKAIINTEQGASIQATLVGSRGSITRQLTGTGSPILFSLNDSDLTTLGVSSTNITISARVTDSAGNTSALVTGSFTKDAFDIDSVAPSVTSVHINSPASGYYKLGDVVTASVAMSEVVSVTGTPQLGLSIGANTRNASYSSGSGSNTLLFTYTIGASDSDNDGISIAQDSLMNNSGHIRDNAGNSASLTHTAVSVNANSKVDVVAPSINSISLSATGAQNGFLNAGDVLTLSVNMSESVLQSGGTSRLMFNLGGDNKLADYASGSGTTQLQYTYTVTNSDNDSDGISLSAGSISIIGDSTKMTDLAGNNLVTSFAAVDANANFKVDTVAPTLTGFKFVRTGNGAASRWMLTYNANEDLISSAISGTTLPVTLLGQNNATISGLTVTSGSGASSMTALYLWSGSPSANSVKFKYDNTVTSARASDRAGNLLASQETTLVTIPTDLAFGTGIADGANRNEITASTGVVLINAPAGQSGTVKFTSSGGGTLTKNYTGNGSAQAITLTAAELGSGSGLLSDGTITAFASANGQGENGIIQTFVMDTVIPTVTPSLASWTKNASNNLWYLRIPTSERVTGSAISNNTIPFTTPAGLTVSRIESEESAVSFVFSGDPSNASISTVQYSSTVTSGQLRDAVGNQVTNFTVDSISLPSAVTIANGVGGGSANRDEALAGPISVTAASGQSYTVTFTDSVGDSIIKTLTGTGSAQAITLAAADIGSTSATLDSKLSDGTITAFVSMNGSGRNGIYKTFVLDAVNPRVNSMSLSATGAQNGYLNVGDVVTLSATFNETVQLSGSSTLALRVGNNTRTANYVSGSGSNILRYTYTISANDSDNDGLSVDAGSISLGTSSSLQDNAGNVATLSYSAISADSSLKVDSVAPSGTVTFAIAADTGVSTSDAITNNNQINVSVRNLESGAGWQWSNNSGSTWTRGTGTSFNLPDKNYSAGEIRVSVVDDAGNSNNSVQNASAIRIDTTMASPTFDSSAGNVRITAESDARLSVQLVGSGTITKTIIGTGQPFNIQLTSAESNTLGTGTITLSASGSDLAGNTCSVASASFSKAAFTIDSVAPSINSMSLSATGAQKDFVNAGDVVTMSVTYSETVYVAGSSTLPIKINTSNVNASYASGSGSNVLNYTYTIGASDNDSNGISADAGSITLAAGAKITDAVGNDATLSFDALADNASFKVDTVKPTLSNVRIFRSAISASVWTIDMDVSEGNLIVSSILLNPPYAFTFVDNTNVAIPLYRYTHLFNIAAHRITINPFADASLSFWNPGNQVVVKLDGSNTNASFTDQAGNLLANFTSPTIVLPTDLTLGTGVSNGASLSEATTGVVTVTAPAGQSGTVKFTDSAGHVVTKNYSIASGSSTQSISLAAGDLGSGASQLADGTITAFVSASGQGESGIYKNFKLDTVAPTMTGMPASGSWTTLTRGTATNLLDLTFSDAQGGTLKLSLEPTNGTLTGVTDSDAATPGVQLSGTGAELTTAFASAQFNAAATGTPALAMTLTDAAGNSALVNYNFAPL